ncbi:MAG: hypothetical protein ACTSVY_15805, partial [Candidatus Helarchaeota archaeon]
MSSNNTYSITKLLRKLKEKNLSTSEIKKILDKIAEIGNQYIAEYLIPFFDIFKDDQELLFALRETLTK